MPEQPDEDLVPPLKVMRKRLNGVYRADSGFHGPTRRYVLIVALLVGLASVPTLAAITAGSNELADGKTDTMDIPLLPPASPGPVRGASPPDSRVGSSPPPAPSALPDRSSSGVGAAPPPVAGVAGAAVRAGHLIGRAGERRPLRGSGPPSPTGSVRRRPGDVSGYAAGKRSGVGGATGSEAGGATGSDKPPARPGEAAGAPDAPSMVAFPALPGMPVVPRLPAVGGRSAHPHSDSNDLSDIDDSDSPDSDSPGPDSPGPDLPGPASPGSAGHDSHADGPDEGPSHRRPDGPGDSRCEKQVIVNRRRSTDRSEHSRRKAVADRPQNIRPASILERSYAPGGQNIRRLIPEARTDDNQIASGSYRGSHRAGSMHHADDTPAQRRSSRVGRHHAEPTEDLSGHR